MLLATEFWDRFAILTPFVGYLVGVFVIAIVAHRYLKGADFESEYYVGGRNFGAWVLAMSWVATLASGGSFLGYPSLINSYGWTMAFWVSGSVVTALIGLGIVAKRINRLARQTGALTLVDLFRDRFQSVSISIAYPLVIVFVTSVYLVAQFAFGAKILANILQVPYSWALFVFALSVVAYTTYGGFRAVAWTDTMQGIVMIVGIVLLVPFALYAVSGMENATLALRDRVDPAAQVNGLPQEKHAYLYGPGPQKITNDVKNRLQQGDPAPPDNPLNDPWLPMSLGISFFMLRSLGALMMPTTVPRMLAFRDTKSLRRALYLLGPYIFLMYGSSLITMNCAHSLNDGLGLGLKPYESDQAVPQLAQIVAPKWLAGFIIAAPFAAVMSTVDSGLLVVSSSVVRDMVQRVWYPDLSEKWTKRLSYAVTGGAGFIVFTVALLTEPTFAQPWVIYYSAGSASALFWPGLAALYWRRATTAGMVCGLVGGIVVFAICHQAKPFHQTVPMHAFVYGFTASAALTVLVSLSTPPQTAHELDRYFGRD